MPIYAYRCSSCGHAQDVLQRMSDPVLTTCPSCGGQTYAKQVTAAGFQLKGSGWYVTDFRGGNQAGAKPEDKPAETAAKGQGGAEAPASAGSAPAPAATTTPAAAPSAGTDN